MKTTVRFFRHGGIYSSDVSFSFKPGPTLTAFRPGTTQAFRAHRKVLRPTHRRDEFRPVIPQRDARQQSPSPLHRHAHPKSVPGSGTMNLQRTVNSVLTACVSPGDNPTYNYRDKESSPGGRTTSGFPVFPQPVRAQRRSTLLHQRGSVLADLLERHF